MKATGIVRRIDELGHTVLTMAVGMLGATVKIGGFIPRAVASTPTRSIPHIPPGFTRPSRMSLSLGRNRGRND